MDEKNNASTNAFFENVDELVNYLFTKFGNLSPLKLQKGLYFLYAYYGATYGHEEKDGELEENFNIPPRLFNADFEAWTYGPVIKSVYHNYKDGCYDNASLNEEEVQGLFNNGEEVQLFIDEVFDQINKVSDFSLVDRSHEDDAWKEAYEQGKSTMICNDKIIEEYSKKYV